MSDPYSTIDGFDDIMEILQNGGSETRTRTRVRVQPQIRMLLQRFETLGWDPVFLGHTFRPLTDQQLSEIPDLIFIEHWAKQTIQSKETIRESLESIGLTPHVVRHLNDICAPLIGSSYSNQQILDVAIEYWVGRYNPLTGITATHLTPQDKRNEWRYDAHLNTNILNIPSRCSTHLDIEAIVQTIPAHNPVHSQLHFHTTSSRGCVSILDGMKGRTGRICLDFGIKPGIYCSQTMQDSLD